MIRSALGHWSRAWLILPAWALMASASVPQITGDDRTILDAGAAHLRGQAEKFDAAHFQGIKCPEDLCWLVLPKVNGLLSVHELTGDPAPLRQAGMVLRAMVTTLQKGDDGTRSWYGSPIPPLLDPAKPEARVREIQTDFRAVAVMSRFLELAAADPALREEFAAERSAWIPLMEQELVEHWHARGHYVELGERGAVYKWNPDYKPNYALLSLPHEKLSMMVDGLIGLYRVGGNEVHAKRAAQIGLWLKSCLALHDGRYSWSRWSPAGTWDILPENPAKWKTWVGADPKGQWYAAAVRTATQLHRHGLVFSDTDMERFTATQTQVCWNGDATAPVFAQTDGKPAKDGERFIAPELAAFNAPLAEFIFGPAASAERLKVTSNDWKGGVLAVDWLHQKYILVPITKNADSAATILMRPFFAKPENAAWGADKTFVVSAPGYTTPPAPPAPTTAPQ